MTTESERRRAPRTKSDAVLELFDKGGHFVTAVGKLVDVSRVGAQFSTSKVFKVGEPLRARFKLSPERAVELGVRVVWVRKRGSGHLYGMEFERELI